MQKRRGFTLIELLVVITIIALLMGILASTLNKAGKQVKSVICQSNLKQRGINRSEGAGDQNFYWGMVDV
jgi:prepilin-type N-terminal cleavage/methylation domain-containing protein